MFSPHISYKDDILLDSLLLVFFTAHAELRIIFLNLFCITILNSDYKRQLKKDETALLQVESGLGKCLRSEFITQKAICPRRKCPGKMLKTHSKISDSFQSQRNSKIPETITKSQSPIFKNKYMPNS